MTTDVAGKIAAEAFAPQFLRSKLTEDEQIELHAHLQAICGREISALLDTIEALKAERDELDFLYHEGGTMEAQLSAAEERAESAEKEASALREQLERAREALERAEISLTHAGLCDAEKAIEARSVVRAARQFQAEGK